jgi:neutral trehalase
MVKPIIPFLLKEGGKKLIKKYGESDLLKGVSKKLLKKDLFKEEAKKAFKKSKDFKTKSEIKNSLLPKELRAGTTQKVKDIKRSKFLDNLFDELKVTGDKTIKKVEKFGEQVLTKKDKAIPGIVKQYSNIKDSIVAKYRKKN